MLKPFNHVKRLFILSFSNVAFAWLIITQEPFITLYFREVYPAEKSIFFKVKQAHSSAPWSILPAEVLHGIAQEEWPIKTIPAAALRGNSVPTTSSTRRQQNCSENWQPPLQNKYFP